MARQHTYIVTEVVQYRVTAASEEEACEIITEDADRDKLCIGVTERTATRED